MKIRTFPAPALSILGSLNFLFAAPPAEKTIPLRPVEYRLDLRLDYQNERIDGDCRFTVRNTANIAVAEIPLLLYRLLRVSSVEDDTGKKLPFHQEVLAFEDFDKYQANFIQVKLPHSIPPRRSQAIRIHYSGHLLGYSEVGMLYVKDHVDKEFTLLRKDCRAYPEIGYPSEKVNRAAGLPTFDYTVSVTVPGALTVANGGRLANLQKTGDEATYTYQNIKPAWRMDFAIARYEIVADEREKLKVFSFPADLGGARSVLNALSRSLEVFTDWFGPLEDYQGFSVIEIPDGWGSQADVSSIIQTAAAFKDPGRLVEVYHEVSHQWNVKCLDPFPARFESEGLAMLLQYRLDELFSGKPGRVEEAVAGTLESFRKQLHENPAYRNIAMIDYGRERITGLSYSKGMLFFYILEQLVGPDDFKRIISTFYQKYGRSGATTHDFAAHVKSSAKIDLSGFLDDWIDKAQSNIDLLSGGPIDAMVRKYRR